MKLRPQAVFILIAALISLTVATARADDATMADLVREPGVRPGLVVVLGPDSAADLVGLRVDDRYLVQGIPSDALRVDALREGVSRGGVYGPVTVKAAPKGRLPYATNTVNLLIVVGRPADLPASELARVLAPYGSMFERGTVPPIDGLTPGKGPGGWTRMDKPYPEEMASWNQPGFDASRAGISSDTLVGPPTALRWIDGPYWTDEYDWAYMKMVSADGRVFYKYNVDDRYGTRRAPGHVIIARDGFNGLKLWERQFPPESGWVMGFNMAVADGKLHIPGRALDVATGEDAGPSKLARALILGDIAVLVPGKPTALDRATGRELWTYARGAYSAVAGDGKLFARLWPDKRQGQRVSEIVCLDLKSGDELWKRESPGGHLFSYRDGVVFTKGLKREEGKSTGITGAVSATDGSLLWSYEYPLPGHGGEPDVWLLGGLAWVHEGDPEGENGRNEKWRGIDPQTGRIVKSILMAEKVKHRCSPHKATVNYVLAGGMDLFDFEAERVFAFHGVRNVCSFGYLPSNGLLYSSPTVCMCFAHLRGTPAVAAEELLTFEEMRRSEGPALERGPAWGAGPGPDPDASDWPTLRGDYRRLGATSVELPAALSVQWVGEAGRGVTSPVAALGLVFAGLRDEEAVAALDGRTGELRWRFRAGGPIDGPPSIAGGRAYFGGRDGWLYCVTADRGELVWRRRMAPQEKWIVSYGGIESTWPVPSSVVVRDGIVYCSAGRHSELDGGIVLSAVNAVTGELLWERTVRREPQFEQVRTGAVDNEMNEVLSTDGEVLYMHVQQFSLSDGTRAEAASDYMWGGPCGFVVDIAKPPYGWKHEEQRQWKWMRATRRWHTKGTALCVADDVVFGLYNDKSELFRHGKGEWRVQVPENLRAKALLVAGEMLFVAFEAGDGLGELRAYAAVDGSFLGTTALPAAPRFDGLAAVSGRLYLSTQDGRIICLAP